MSLKSPFVLTSAVVLCLAAAAPAQDQSGEQPKPKTGEQTFRLQRDSESAAKVLDFDDAAQGWQPRVDQGTVEVSLSLGFLGLSSTLLEHQQIIYKYTLENTYFGDVKITGESAFNPVLRCGVNVSRWFAVEGQGGLSFSDYTTTIVNRKYQKNEAGAQVIADPALGEFDAEARSLLTGQAGFNAVVYPLNIRRRITGRLHPFVTGGVERFWYNMNSNFTEGSASAWGANLGAGIRLLADENVSVRFEVVMHRNTLEWTPAEYFDELNEGTLQIPLEEWPVDGERSRVTEFAKHDMNLLNWSLGIQGTF